MDFSRTVNPIVGVFLLLTGKYYFCFKKINLELFKPCVLVLLTVVLNNSLEDMNRSTSISVYKNPSNENLSILTSLPHLRPSKQKLSNKSPGTNRIDIESLPYSLLAAQLSKNEPTTAMFHPVLSTKPTSYYCSHLLPESMEVMKCLESR